MITASSKEGFVSSWRAEKDDDPLVSDDDSSSSSSWCQDDDDDNSVSCTPPIYGGGSSTTVLSDFDGFQDATIINEDEDYDTSTTVDDPMVRQMQGLLALKAQLGMDKDPSFLGMTNSSSQKAAREQQRRQEAKMAGMTAEQRLKYKQALASTSTMTSILSVYVDKMKLAKERKARREAARRARDAHGSDAKKDETKRGLVAKEEQELAGKAKVGSRIEPLVVGNPMVKEKTVRKEERRQQQQQQHQHAAKADKEEGKSTIQKPQRKISRLADKLSFWENRCCLGPSNKK